MAVLKRIYADQAEPLAYEREEDFRRRPPRGCLQIVLIEQGSVALKINQDRNFLQAGALLFFHDGVRVERLHDAGLRARSVSFSPGFINRNLTMQNIAEPSFSELRREFGYPSFHLFFDWDHAYSGVLPLDLLTFPKAKTLMDGAIAELEGQTDSLWPCRTRVNLLELLQLAEEIYAQYVGKNQAAAPLARAVLKYIHANYDKDITMERLCEEYHTNHTTLLREFRVLTGDTIAQYTMKYRLHLAKEALLFTSLSIEEIALKCGFKQAAYFSRLFRKSEGMPLGRFRMLKVDARKKARGGFISSRPEEPPGRMEEP